MRWPYLSDFTEATFLPVLSCFLTFLIAICFLLSLHWPQWAPPLIGTWRTNL